MEWLAAHLDSGRVVSLLRIANSFQFSSQGVTYQGPSGAYLGLFAQPNLACLVEIQHGVYRITAPPQWAGQPLQACTPSCDHPLGGGVA